jgi:hypothetical protein
MKTRTTTKPLVLHPYEVRGLLDGTVTQLRRVVWPLPALPVVAHITWSTDLKRAGLWRFSGEDDNNEETRRSPFGPAGGVVWCKEAFYDRADYGSIATRSRFRFAYVADNDSSKTGWKKHPAGHMPIAASRIHLRIVEQRVERLQDSLVGEEWNAHQGKRAGCGWSDNPWVFVARVERLENQE